MNATQQDDEIKLLKEFITKIYFKENVKDDYDQKNEFLAQIDELELIKLDEDFYQHLYTIYENVTKRQQANIEEFKSFSLVIESQRTQIKGREEEINKKLNSNIEDKLKDFENTLQEKERQLSLLEENLSESENALKKLIQEITYITQQSSEEYEKEVDFVRRAKQNNSEQVKRQRQDQEKKLQYLQGKLKEQNTLKQQIEQNERQLDKITIHIQNLMKNEEKLTLIEQQKQQYDILKKKCQILDTQISLKKLNYEELSKENPIIERKHLQHEYYVQPDYTLIRERDKLKSQVDDMEQASNNFRCKIQETLKNTEIINDKIAKLRKQKEQKSIINLFLIIFIIIIIITILYKLF